MRLELVWTDRQRLPDAVPEPRSLRDRVLDRVSRVPESSAAGEPHRRFLDFVVDGCSLYQQFAYQFDLISCLGWISPEEDELAAERLLAQAPPDVDGRVSIYVCPACADLDCGAVTVLVQRAGDELLWTDVALSRMDYDRGAWRHELLERPMKFRFDSRSYERTIRARPKPVILD